MSYHNDNLSLFCNKIFVLKTIILTSLISLEGLFHKFMIERIQKIFIPTKFDSEAKDVGLGKSWTLSSILICKSFRHLKF